jgi:hypothetical protein
MKTKLIVKDGKVIELKEEDLVRESSPQVFSIGGKSGFKWRTESANKTWIENGNIIKEKKGKRIPK